MNYRKNKHSKNPIKYKSATKILCTKHGTPVSPELARPSIISFSREFEGEPEISMSKLTEKNGTKEDYLCYKVRSKENCDDFGQIIQYPEEDLNQGYFDKYYTSKCMRYPSLLSNISFEKQHSTGMHEENDYDAWKKTRKSNRGLRKHLRAETIRLWFRREQVEGSNINTLEPNDTCDSNSTQFSDSFITKLGKSNVKTCEGESGTTLGNVEPEAGSEKIAIDTSRKEGNIRSNRGFYKSRTLRYFAKLFRKPGKKVALDSQCDETVSENTPPADYFKVLFSKKSTQKFEKFKYQEPFKDLVANEEKSHTQPDIAHENNVPGIDYHATSPVRIGNNVLPFNSINPYNSIDFSSVREENYEVPIALRKPATLTERYFGEDEKYRNLSEDLNSVPFEFTINHEKSSPKKNNGVLYEKVSSFFNLNFAGSKISLFTSKQCEESPTDTDLKDNSSKDIWNPYETVNNDNYLRYDDDTDKMVDDSLFHDA
ncbi:hypothetical protein DASC09_004200 [Saccharomycopsis crataegensis]|uniref:Uncharacterized protein n=1 Tax=Saccharomycopsis crataegensis TaxID=43959 RepID=A0AAV5QFB0_9ASCO|nr:hypothetical protein DASC09_004200 [Saccharomycopsis crataegensis]